MNLKLIVQQSIFIFFVSSFVPCTTNIIHNEWETLLLDNKNENFINKKTSAALRNRIVHRSTNFRSSNPVIRHIASSSFGSHEELELDRNLYETQLGNPVHPNSILTEHNEVTYSIPENIPEEHPTSLIKCSRPGYLVNPMNCARFYNCIKFGKNYKLFSLNCVDGTIFYSRISKCVNPGTISPKLRPACTPSFDEEMSAEIINEVPEYFPETMESQNTVNSVIHGFRGEIENFDVHTEASRDEEMNDLPLKGREIVDDDIETFIPISVASTQNFSIQTAPSRSNANELLNADYYPDDDDDNSIQLNSIFDNIKDMQSTELHSIEPIRRSRAKSNPTMLNKPSSPKVWFGFRSNRDPNVISSIGNPFKDDETTLAVILDFATSRLQIYSKHKLPK